MAPGDLLRIADFVAAPAACHFHRNLITPRSVLNGHRHDFLELFWIEEGSGWEEVDGRRHELRAGTLGLVAADDRHGFGSDSAAGFRLANLAFPVSTWQALRSRLFADRTDPFAPGAPRRFDLGPTAARELTALADEFDDGRRTLAALERFLLNLLRLLERLAPHRDHPAPDWLAHALARLAAEPRLLVDGPHALVALCGRSPEHVAREARRRTGRTPTDLVNDARIAWAARRLVESDDDPLALCLACGLSNLGHFYKLFRERLGDSPGRWRARQRRIVVG